MIKAVCISAQDLNVRSHGDSRRRVDRFIVEFQCPADKINPAVAGHLWRCGFEVGRGSVFVMRDFACKADARAAMRVKYA